MAKTNKQLQAEIDKLTIEKNNLVDMLEISEKGIRGVSKILGLDGIAENTYFNDADIETIEKAIEKLQGKYEKCFEELSMKCGECEGLLKANETIVKAHNELELDKKDLHKRLIEGLQINIEKVEKIGELENKVDEQFKVITKYEKELEEQDKEIEELKEEYKKLQSNNVGNSEYIFDLEKGIDGIIEELGLKISFEGAYTIGDFEEIEIAISKLKNQKFEKLRGENKKLEEEDKEIKEKVLQIDTFIKLNNKIEELKEENHDLDTMLKNATERIKEQNGLIVELKEELENYSGIKIEKKQDTFVISKTANQDLFDCLQKELQSQIILKNTYKKENKRLKKRRREGRYNPKKVYEKLARGWLCYIPEGDYLPTKVHESLIDAMEEGHRLADKTGNQVYIVGTYCKI